MRGEVYTLKAEFDQARILGRRAGIPVHMVLRAVEKAAWKSAGKKGSDQMTHED